MVQQIRPNYKIFQTSNHDFFLFDTYKNSIKSISRNCFIKLKELNDKKEDFYVEIEKIEDNEFQKFYIESLEEGYFKDYHIAKIQHPMTELLEDILDANIESINLQVTQNCNLRCEYCPYTGNYYSNRNHANKKMDFVMAKKGIDFLYHHSRDSDVVNIAFYGGEPLLEFELIKECIKYTEELFCTKEVAFSITSNGTLLSAEIMDYFFEHNVLLTISLDGPEKIHNRHRVFSNGKGSFNIIYENLCIFREKYPDYFIKNVMFNVVCKGDESVIELDKFFGENKLFDKCEVVTTFYSTNYVINEPDQDKRVEKFVEHFEFEKYKCFLYMMGRTKSFPTRMQLNSFHEAKKTARELSAFSGMPKVFHPAGPCVPGRKKLFMNAYGNFYPCERIDETSPCSVIGNIDSGFSLKKCEELLNVGKITEDKCINCWAIAHCKFCFVQADDGEKLCSKNRLKKCSDLHNSIIDVFKDISVLEKNGYHFEWGNN